jgi:hypothetical protein
MNCLIALGAILPEKGGRLYHFTGQVFTQTLYDSWHALRVSVLKPIVLPPDTQEEYAVEHWRTQLGSELLISISEML